MGRAVQMGLVDPLLGGINAGHTDQLSAAVAAPQLLAAARRDRSLVRGLRASGPAATGAATGGGPGETGAGAPVFLTVRGGLSRLVDALASGIAAAPGGEIVSDDGVAALVPDGARWSARLRSGRVITADAVIVACPAPAAATLVGAVSPTAAATLRSIGTASVALTLLAYPSAAVPEPLDGSGFLVPRPEGRLITAASWVGGKWPHLATPGLVLIRASAGRVDDHRAMELGDEELIAASHAELTSAMGLRASPIEARVHRWPDAFPQYEVDHLDRMASVERQLATDAPGVVLAGAALRGVGIATCIAGARVAAGRAAELAAVLSGQPAVERSSS